MPRIWFEQQKNTPCSLEKKNAFFGDSPKKKWNFFRPAEKLFHTSNKVWAFDQKNTSEAVPTGSVGIYWHLKKNYVDYSHQKVISRNM